MTTSSPETKIREIARTIVAEPPLHARWLNTLSLMENCGARKISAFEHPVHTDLVILKHAAEEARHAYYLKKQILKVGTDCTDYRSAYLLAPMESYQYLHRLDAEACRLLAREYGMYGDRMKFGAYLLVTYAIEVRADLLYGVYQEELTAAASRVNVKSIIAEEEGHLREMTSMLERFDPAWHEMADRACRAEQHLFDAWLDAIARHIREEAPGRQTVKAGGTA